MKEKEKAKEVERKIRKGINTDGNNINRKKSENVLEIE